MFEQSVSFTIQNGLDFPLPNMVRIQQHFNDTRIDDPEKAVIEALSGIHLPNLQGKRVGITAGSRRLDNLPIILGAMARFLRSRGAYPFVIPAMGSHGGACAEGQSQLLADLGITEKTVDMPIISNMEVEAVGSYNDGAPIVCSKTARDADYVIVCARVKAHTSIKGNVESGLCKMLTVGLGKHIGAANFHRHGYDRLAEILPDAAAIQIKNLRVLCGVALVENAYDQTMRIEAISPEQIISREAELLKLSKKNMPHFLLDDIDVLVIDRMGKDISGAGMDPNITGRAITPLPMKAQTPIRTIVALHLTEASHGNATGIGGADITTRRVVDSIDLNATYTNAFTSGALAAVKIPVVLDNDESAIRVAIRCTPRESLSDVKIVHIQDTLHLGEIDISENYLQKLQGRPDIRVVGASPFHFDCGGWLIPPWTKR